MSIKILSSLPILQDVMHIVISKIEISRGSSNYIFESLQVSVLVGCVLLKQTSGVSKFSREDLLAHSSGGRVDMTGPASGEGSRWWLSMLEYWMVSS